MIEAIIVIAAVALDRITKLWASKSLAAMPGGRMEFIRGTVDFRYVENTGASFSMLSNHTWLLIVISFIAIFCIAFFYIKYRLELNLISRICLAAIMGGAIGNLIDRLAYGYVVDFIDPVFVNFAVFNIADIFITCGAILLVFVLLLVKPSKKNEH